MIIFLFCALQLQLMDTLALVCILGFTFVIPPFLGVDTRSVETTFGMEENMQMCHSLRCKQIDTSTADQLKSIFPNNAGMSKVAPAHARTG